MEKQEAKVVSVFVSVPAVRLVVVKATADYDDVELTIEDDVYPVLALRTEVYEDGGVNTECLITGSFSDYTLVPPYYPLGLIDYRIIPCPWDISEDKERLRSVVKEVREEAVLRVRR